MTITTTATTVSVKSKYNPDFIARAKNLGGRWQPADKTWVFPRGREAEVRALCAAIYGTTAEAAPAPVAAPAPAPAPEAAPAPAPAPAPVAAPAPAPRVVDTEIARRASLLEIDDAPRARPDHLRESVLRAYEVLATGNWRNAATSLVVDFMRDASTADLVPIARGLALACASHNDAQRFIGGYGIAAPTPVAAPVEPAPAPVAAPAPASSPAALQQRLQAITTETGYTASRTRNVATTAARVAPVAPIAPVAASTGGVSAADGLVLTAEASEIAGCVTYWHLSDDSELPALTAAWAAEGLDPSWLPEPLSPVVALSRACAKMRTSRTLVRKHPESGWLIVRERDARTDAGEATLDYEVGLHAYLAKGTFGEPTLAFAAPATLPADERATYEAEIRSAYEHNLSTLDHHTISAWLIGLTSTLGAVALRETGGLYFVPRTNVETWHRIKRAVRSVTHHVIYALPAVRSADTIESALGALTGEIEKSLQEIENELTSGIGSRAKQSRLRTLDAARDKAASYGRLLGADFTALNARIADLTRRVNATNERGELLEID